MQKNLSKQSVTAGLLLAMGVLIPIVFHYFALGGPTFLPMHLPILLGGFLLSPVYALLLGALTPLLSSVLTGMPILFPMAVQMSFELATYGFVISYLYERNTKNIYVNLISGMLAGRFIAGIVNYILLSQFLAKAFNFKVFLTASFVTGLPGIVTQLILVPALIKLLERAYVLESKRG